MQMSHDTRYKQLDSATQTRIAETRTLIMNAMSEQFRVYEDEEERVQRQEQISSSSEEGYAPALQRLVSDFSLSSWMQTMYSSFEQLLCYHPSRVVMQYE
jgi:hypothetical protein